MTTAAASTTTPRKGLHVGLWVVQALLALAFGAAGLLKLFAPVAQLAARMSWVPHVPEGLVRFIGVSELAGALGLVLPSLTRVQPKLTPLAAAALVAVMVLAAGVHVSLGEAPLTGVNAVLGGLAAFVAWGRFARAPIAPKA